jgi:hypothetical protein
MICEQPKQANGKTNNQPRKKNQMNKILIAYIIGLVVGAGATLCIVEQLLK